VGRKVEAQKGSAQALPTPRIEWSATPRLNFAEFFRATYRDLVQTAMYGGATRQEGEDAASATMEEVFRRWAELREPLAYARRAVISNLIKEKTRNLDRVRQRQIECGAASSEGDLDPELTAWEDEEWIRQMLASLPPRQRSVMTFIVEGFSPAEIATLLGQSPAAVRQSLHVARHRLLEALRKAPADEHDRRAAAASRREVP
jgi:RNA polymerase sigma factor (sigma-70 family)